MNKIIAAVRDSTLDIAMKEAADTIFYLTPNITTLEQVISKKGNKKIYIHMDMAEGIAKDRFGIKYVKNLGADGIISTRAGIIKSAKEEGLLTVQRFFVIDGHSLKNIVEMVKLTRPDMIEIMPGIAGKVIDRLKNNINIPIIAGGLIETAAEAEAAIKSGAYAISTSNTELWRI